MAAEVVSTRPVGKSIFKGAAALAVGRGGAMLISAAWLVVAARILPLPAFGDLVLIIAIGTICSNLSDRGIQLVVGRAVAANGVIGGNLLRAALVRRLVAALLMSVVSGAAFLVVTHGADILVPVVFSLSILGTAVHTTVLAAYRGLGLSAWEMVNEIGSRLLVLLLGAWWLLNGGGLLAAVAVYALADVVSAVVLVVALRIRYVSPLRPGLLPPLGLRDTMPFVLAASIAVAYQRIDSYIVGLLKGAETAGLYGASYRFLDAALVPAMAIGGLILAHAAQQDASQRRATASRLSLVALALTAVPVVGGVLLAAPAMRLIFGSSFGVAAPIMALLLVSALPGAIVGVVTPLAAITSPARFAQAVAAALGLNVVLNLAVVPSLGGIGAAGVNLASQLLLAVMLAWILERAHRAPSNPIPAVSR
jgi:O-antigen/teichoic acid export membrane protein